MPGLASLRSLHGFSRTPGTRIDNPLIFPHSGSAFIQSIPLDSRHPRTVAPPRKRPSIQFDSDGIFYEMDAVIYTALMTNQRKHATWLRSFSSALLAAAIVAVVFSAGAQEQDQKPPDQKPDAADIAE